MKKTKEINERKEIEILSKEEAIEFKNIATGRKFSKKGSRLIDICDEEIEKYEYQSLGFFARLFKRSKFKRKEERLLLEDRFSSTIRNIAIDFINNEEIKEVRREELIRHVKKVILTYVNQYLEEKNN